MERDVGKKGAIAEGTDAAVLQWKCGFEYFVRRRTQDEIAAAMRVSRPTVVRYVRAVEPYFTMTPNFAAAPYLTASLEEGLREKFALRRAIVPPVWSDEYELTTQLLGRAAKFVFEEIVRAAWGDRKRAVRVGVAGGETVLSMALALHPLDVPMDIYPLVVGPHPDTELSAGAIAGIMVRQLRCRRARVEAHPLVHFGRVSLKRGSRSPPSRRRPDVSASLDWDSLKQAKDVEVAVLGIGSPNPGTTFSRVVERFGADLLERRTKKPETSTLKGLGLLSEVASQLLPPRQGPGRTSDRSTHDVRSHYNASVTGVALADLVRLAAAPHSIVLAVAGGRSHKLDAIHHSLTCIDDDGHQFRPFNTLLTDAATAEALMNFEGPSTAEP